MYSHCFKKQMDITDEQWETLCAKVSEVFRNLPVKLNGCSYEDQSLNAIFDGVGIRRITDAKQLFIVDRGRKFIVFNGDASIDLSYETFILRQKGQNDVSEWYCKTDRKPYDFFVTAVLILVDNLCPGCYRITSNGKDEWVPVLDWLNHTLDTNYQIPVGVNISDQ